MPFSARFTRFAIVACIFLFFFSAHLKNLMIFILIGHDTQECAPPVSLPPPSPPKYEPVPTKTGPAPVVAEMPQKPLGQHTFLPNGMLEVNPEGAHPIYTLVKDAEERWNEKVSRASKSLEEAIAEYKRRYKRPPPKGFDDWWEYVVQNDVQLPDEYDQIHRDLEHYWGIEPRDLRKIQKELETKLDSYTLGKTATGPVEVVTSSFQEGRYNQLIVGSVRIIGLLEEIDDVLPAFRATFSPHDGPNRLTDYGVQQAVLKAAREYEPIEIDDLPKINPIGWVSACSPDSPARQFKIDLDNPPPPPANKSFIYDHRLAMDPCNHPQLFFQHGQFLSHNYGPTPQTEMVPEFSQCSSTLHHNIRIPTPYGWVEDIYPRADDPDFDDKTDERLLWRGSNTGIFHSSTSRWKPAHRNRLIEFTNDLNGTANILPPNKTQDEPVGDGIPFRKSRLNPALLDIAYSGSPHSCAEPVCKQLATMYEWRRMQSIKEAGSYKYVLDVDGNGWSGRFKRLITSNSLVFKATIYPEWYSDRIQPWLHYVPVQVDLSDLHDSLLFFRGDPSGAGAHEDMARTIAAAGREWSKTYWRREDLIAYFFRLRIGLAYFAATHNLSTPVDYDEDWASSERQTAAP
ncbi:Glycosyltransferase Family 90 domain containing protein [Pleurotus pulmonarius]|nr:Glycosyltransferase Family 90 domain containing protein [Pleurotus pulmonarius]